MASHRPRPSSVIEVLFVGAIAGAISCDGGGSGATRPALDRAKVSALTAGRTTAADQARVAAGQEQAKADAYARQAAAYARIASANRAAATADAALAARETAAAATIMAPTRLAPALAHRQGDREQAAALADGLAANAQHAADFHSAKASALSGGTAAGGGR